MAWFAIAAAVGRPITIFGDGCQVRDLLWVEDLCDLYWRAIEQIDSVSGQVYNVGGGAANALSVREVLRMLEELYGKSLNASHGPWRPGDQRLFIADTGKAERDLGWTPRTSTAEGIARLVEWVKQSADDIEAVVAT